MSEEMGEKWAEELVKLLKLAARGTDVSAELIALSMIAEAHDKKSDQGVDMDAVRGWAWKIRQMVENAVEAIPQPIMIKNALAAVIHCFVTWTVWDGERQDRKVIHGVVDEIFDAIDDLRRNR